MRPSRHSMYLAMARAAATRATCYRLNVGAVLVYDRNVVSVGYNGAPAGEEHCTGNGCRYFQPSGCRVVHAEQNALTRLAEWVEDRAYDLYVTHSPCGGCARLIVANRLIRTVFFETAYRDPNPVTLLTEGGVDVYQVLPSGLVVDVRTGNLCEP